MQTRVVFGGIALLIFLPFLIIGGLSFQLFVGLMAMIGVSEMFRIRRLEVFSLEGILSMMATFCLVVPLGNYLTFLPVEASLIVYGILIFALLAGTVLNHSRYSIEDAAYPIISTIYVGLGFHYLIAARDAGFDKVFFALLLVWATDIGAYTIGRRYGRTPLMPTVSPNKTIEGSLGGVVSAVIVSVIFMMVDSSVYTPHSFLMMLILVVIFSITGQFGDLIESAMKRHFGVKDSGKLIPGHGGILDRFDSLLLVFPMMYLFGLF